MSEIKVRKENKKTKVISIFIALIFVMFLGLLYINLNTINKNHLIPVDPADNSFIAIIIPERSTATQVAQILYKNDLIHSEEAFSRYCKKEGIASALKAGRYKLSRSQTLEQIAMSIARGDIASVRITIPEGYSLEQIGQVLIQQNICSEDDWLNAINASYEYNFLEARSGQRYVLEGFLFPDTYQITEEASAEDIIRIMLDNYERIWNSEFAESAKASGFDTYEIITIASLIEKEAMISAERPTIAGVIYNRLDRGMLLQMCASVIYSHEKHINVLSLEDLKIDSPYNTYKYLGLPPGPIASPGRNSIKAALNPDNHSYYYYVAKGDGSHQFSKTHAEHLQAQSKYQ